MATITNHLSSLDHSGHPQLPVCARRQGGQAEDAHHGQVRRQQVTSDHNHHNHWRTAKYGVTNLAPLSTDQMPIITTILTLITDQTCGRPPICGRSRPRGHDGLARWTDPGDTSNFQALLKQCKFFSDFENVVIQFENKISQF